MFEQGDDTIVKEQGELIEVGRMIAVREGSQKMCVFDEQITR